VFSKITEIGSISTQARLFLLICGILLCVWALRSARERTLLVSMSSLFTGIGLGMLFFAIFPRFFDRISYVVGIKYPPLLYLILGLLIFMVITAHLASRLSLVDQRCRRLAQEIALLTSAREKPE
jgi:hypothetical protein